MEDEDTVDKITWTANYKPPPPAEQAGERRRDPEAVEAEMRQRERELQKLLLIKVK